MILRILGAIGLVVMGWAAAHAQTAPSPDELSIVSTADGKTRVECVRGCGLQWVTRVAPNRESAKKDFTFGCFNGWDRLPDGCPSGRLAGWVIK